MFIGICILFWVLSMVLWFKSLLSFSLKPKTVDYTPLVKALNEMLADEFVVIDLSIEKPLKNKKLSLWYHPTLLNQLLGVAIYHRETKQLLALVHFDSALEIGFKNLMNNWLAAENCSLIYLAQKSDYDILDILHITKEINFINEHQFFSTQRLITTEQLAQKLGVRETILLVCLEEMGFIKKTCHLYQLTYIGEIVGGSRKVSAHFGERVLWPNTLDVESAYQLKKLSV